MKLPTGGFQPDQDWGFGTEHNSVLQPGSGSLSPVLGGFYSQKLGNVNLSGNLIYRLSGGENVHGYKFGDEFQYTAGIAYRPLKGVRLSMQLNGIHTGYDYDGGAKVDNTGGRWIYLTPSLTIGHGEISYQTTVQKPLYRYVNNSQLTSDYVFTFRAWYTFGGNKRKAVPSLSPRHDTVTSDTPDIATISLGEAVALEKHLVPGKITLFEFYSDICSSCEALEPMLRELVKSSPDVALRKISSGSGQSAVVQQYKITATPEIRVFDQGGKFVETVVASEIQPIQAAIAKIHHKKRVPHAAELFKQIPRGLTRSAKSSDN